MRLRRLTTSERIIAWRLASGRLVSNTELQTALYGKDRKAHEGVVSVLLCRLRSALDNTSVSINGQHGQGWEVDRVHLDQFRSLLAQEIEDHVLVPYEPRIMRSKTRDASAEVSL